MALDETLLAYVNNENITEADKDAFRAIVYDPENKYACLEIPFSVAFRKRITWALDIFCTSKYHRNVLSSWTLYLKDFEFFKILDRKYPLLIDDTGPEGQTFLHLVCRFGSEDNRTREFVKYLIETHRFLLEETKNPYCPSTPLFELVKYDIPTVQKQLLSYEARTDYAYEGGETIFFNAHENSIFTLIWYGAYSQLFRPTNTGKNVLDRVLAEKTYGRTMFIPHIRIYYALGLRPSERLPTEDEMDEISVSEDECVEIRYNAFFARSLVDRLLFSMKCAKHFDLTKRNYHRLQEICNVVDDTQ